MGLPVRVLSNRPFAKNCRLDSSAVTLIEKGAIDMIVRRPEMRLKLASILAKLMNLPAPNPEAPREGVVVPPVPDQEPEA